MDRVAPIVEYARKIGKNTSEWTATDMSKFVSWWMKQPMREDLIVMAKRHNLAAFQAAQRSRLNSDQVADIEQVDDSVVEEMQEEVMSFENETVCTMELTRTDVEALLFCIGRTFEDYEMEENHPHTVSLLGLKEGLEGV